MVMHAVRKSEGEVTKMIESQTARVPSGTYLSLAIFIRCWRTKAASSSSSSRMIGPDPSITNGPRRAIAAAVSSRTLPDTMPENTRLRLTASSCTGWSSLMSSAAIDSCVAVKGSWKSRSMRSRQLK